MRTHLTRPSATVAAPIASEPPTLNRAWADFLAHLPTMVLIWLTTMAISAVGALVYGLIAAITVGLVGTQSSSNSSELLTSVGVALGQLGQLPFTLLSALVGVLLSAVPALYYNSGSNISIETAFRTLLKRPWRYLVAGALYSAALGLGSLLCILPGVAVGLTGPVYVNLIFTSDDDIATCFTTAFQRIYGSERGRNYAFVEVLTWMVVIVASICTCGLGALLAVPVASFYLQQLAYSKELV